MAKSSFIPSTDSDFQRWYNNFSSALPAQQALFGLSDEDIAAIVAANQSLSAKLQAADAAAAAAKVANAEKSESRRKADGDARGIARRIKAHPKYTPAIGQLLGIEGAESSGDLSAARPDVFVANLGGGKAEVSFNKSNSHGVNVYGWREGDADFVFLARDNASPYVDERPPAAAGKPELRRYKLVYVLADEEVGQFSAIVETVVTP
ncbi:hypothetical protein [Methylococcus sp. EFPC2]|uniref:hypothetical protein n=1 Tax=Methylococcus sp. EFPC2 TaxID=2812648 RepID=UPI001967A3C3|nr:hypothetical protein [Methylococcus sp. EFPC2]QSA96794.1 hypothetical protein JWZ97_16540 [Methylococcus sp. EFPC2]